MSAWKILSLTKMSPGSRERTKIVSNSFRLFFSFFLESKGLSLMHLCIFLPVFWWSGDSALKFYARGDLQQHTCCKATMNFITVCTASFVQIWIIWAEINHAGRRQQFKASQVQQILLKTTRIEDCTDPPRLYLIMMETKLGPMDWGWDPKEKPGAASGAFSTSTLLFCREYQLPFPWQRPKTPQRFLPPWHTLLQEDTQSLWDRKQTHYLF